jgi:hypothetical protein
MPAGVPARALENVETNQYRRVVIHGSLLHQEFNNITASPPDAMFGRDPRRGRGARKSR